MSERQAGIFPLVIVSIYTRGTKVLQHPNHNGAQIFLSFATLKIIIPLSRMLKNKMNCISDKNSHTCKHLKSSDKCRKSCSDNCFTALDTASIYNQLKIKEAFHAMRENLLLSKCSLNFLTPFLSLITDCHSFIECVYINVF